MKNTSRFVAVLIILFVAGIQQAGQGNSEADKRDRLLADENMSLTRAVALCQGELEKQKKLLVQSQLDNKKLTQKAISDANTIRTLQNEFSQSRTELAKLQKQLEQCQQMVDLKDAPGLCRDKIDKMKKQLEQCRRENEQIKEASGRKAEEFFNKIPQELRDELAKLTGENAALQQKIAELEKKQKDVNEPNKAK